MDYGSLYASGNQNYLVNENPHCSQKSDKNKIPDEYDRALMHGWIEILLNKKKFIPDFKTKRGLHLKSVNTTHLTQPKGC